MPAPTVPTSAAEFLAEVRRLGLIDDPRRLAAWDAFAGPLDALAPEVAAAGLLTAFQIQELLSGRGEGLIVRQYVLLERVGAGGMGEVFRARHRVLGRIDAVKRIRPDRLAGSDAVRRFRQEAKLAARCSHPNLVAVYDADEVEGGYFLAMEFVAGTDLHALVRARGPMPFGLACDFARQAALGLSHAHEKGLIHRDVKPANLLLAGSQVKVTDLGLARALARNLDGDESSATASEIILGTPDFIAPEQCSDPRLVDHRADIYALGCTLYFLLAGRPPFPGGTAAEKLFRHMSERPAPVDQLCPALPPGVAAAVAAMMHKEPGARPPTAADAAAIVEAFADASRPLPPLLDAAPMSSARSAGTGWAPTFISGARAGVSTQAPVQQALIQKLRRRRWLDFLAGAVACAIVAAILFAINGRSKPRDINGGNGDGGQTGTPSGTQTWPHSWRIVYQYHFHRVGGFALAFSPDGRYLVHVSGDSTQPGVPSEVRLWNTTTEASPREPVWKTTLPAVARCCAVAAEGKMFVVGAGDWKADGDGTITFWTPDSSSPRGTAAHPRGTLALAFAPGGRFLVSGGRDGRVRVWELDGPKDPTTAPP